MRPASLALLLATLTLAAPALAQALRSETVTAEAAATGTVIAGTVKGDDSVAYLVTGQAGQTLSVDLASTNPSLSFNILPQGNPEALFIGSTSGNVADVSLPGDGTYVVQVYLMRNAARRDDSSDYTLGIGLAGGDFADGLAGGPDWWQVTGLPGTDPLDIHTGPDTRYAVAGVAQTGELMQNRGCRMTGEMRWCSVRVDGSGLQGWAVGQYLSEAAAPATAQVPAGGPAGNGVPFDATGYVTCADTAGADPAQCPFGVVRDGPGNAGVWIVLPGGTERQILFEGGSPIDSDAGIALSFTKTDDLFDITIGAERFSFPDALVNGG